MGLSITPGQTQFTRTLGAHSIASWRVRFTMAAFDAALADEIAPPASP